MGNRGKREFIQVLRLLEAISKEVVTDAVTEAIRLGTVGFDAVNRESPQRFDQLASGEFDAARPLSLLQEARERKVRS